MKGKCESKINYISMGKIKMNDKSQNINDNINDNCILWKCPCCGKVSLMYFKDDVKSLLKKEMEKHDTESN